MFPIYSERQFSRSRPETEHEYFMRAARNLRASVETPGSLRSARARIASAATQPSIASWMQVMRSSTGAPP